MPLVNDIKSDIKAAKKIRLPWWGVLTWMAACVPIIWLFDHSGRFDLALPTLVSIGMLGFVIAVKRKLRRHGWFWGTMAILAALHVPLILFVPWTTKWVPALAIAGIGSADVCLMLAILAVVAKFMEGPKTAAPDSDH
jgi:ABC-type multidrug transport system permease subunit